jgi:hypothetical protein
MEGNDPQVVAEVVEGVPAEGMPQDGGVGQSEATPPASTTTTTPANDAKGDRPVTQADIRRMQSAYDSRISQMERGWQSREADYLRRLAEAETRGMTDEQRRAYEFNQVIAQNQQMQQALYQQQQEAAARQQMGSWAEWFEGNGVPATKLDRTSPDKLLETGWAYITDVLKRSGGGAQPAQPVKPTVPVAAPAVMTNKGGGIAGKTWEGQKKKWNVTTDEELFRLVETGQIPASELPFT